MDINECNIEERVSVKKLMKNSDIMTKMRTEGNSSEA
jgi:hypothetical protein